jgi:nucleoside-diphosphate-sugar epimerase
MSTKKILILGCNGFIGSNLTEAILNKTDWEIYGMDLADNKLGDTLKHPRCHFTKGDIIANQDWVEEHIKKCDVILPLVAVATPSIYITDPLRVFELDFEANLPIVRQCVKYKKRLIFPSTSEVYGMSPDTPFDEENSALMQGPINKERWIYSCCKQLMDRVIYAYGHHGSDLQFTLFRPFNWTGPKLDDVHNLKEGSSRVVSQFLSNIIYGKDLQLVAGGTQKRCFTYIDDAIEAMLIIIENKNNCASQRIFNIGNPDNNASIKEIAEKLIKIAKNNPNPKYNDIEKRVKIVSTDPAQYYGSGYQDVQLRVPSIKNAVNYLGWKPTTNLDKLLQLTANYYL